MKYKYKILTALIVFSLFMAGITVSISYSANKIKELSNPFYFIPDNSTFVLYSQFNGAKSYTYVSGNLSGVILYFPSNHLGTFSTVFSKGLNESISISYVTSSHGSPIYKFIVNLNKTSSNLNTSNSLGSYRTMYVSNTFCFANPLPGIDIMGKLPAIEDSLRAYSINQGKNERLENFIDSNSIFSFVYMSNNGTPIKFISANLTSNGYFISILFNNSVNANKIYFTLEALLPHYILVYPPVGEKVEIKILGNYVDILVSLANQILSIIMG